MSVEYFLDTNIVVYMFDDREPQKQEKATQIVQDVLENRNGCISYQVVQETMYVLIKKLKNVNDEDAEQALNDFLIPLWRINPLQQALPTQGPYPNPKMYNLAFKIYADYNISNFYDCVIVANAIEAGCDTIYTEECKLVRKGRLIEDINIVNPLRQNER